MFKFFYWFFYQVLFLFRMFRDLVYHFLCYYSLLRGKSNRGHIIRLKNNKAGYLFNYGKQARRIKRI